jgi:hypothetical protein
LGSGYVWYYLETRQLQACRRRFNMGRILSVIVFVMSTAFLASCNHLAKGEGRPLDIEEKAKAAGDDITLKPGETIVQPDRLPATVKAAVAARMSGFEILRAKREVFKNGRTIYAVLGRAEGRHYEMEVSPEGKVLEVEEDDDVDDDDTDDDPDDDDQDDDTGDDHEDVSKENEDNDR